MHDELPSGDLSEMLGEIKHVQDLTAEDEEREDEVPILGENDQKYHLIVVAGQECELRFSHK